MSRQTNSIGYIKLPGETENRPLVPYALGYSTSNSYQATLPQLTADSEIIIDKQDQTISGYKNFTSGLKTTSVDFEFKDTHNMSITRDGLWWKFSGPLAGYWKAHTSSNRELILKTNSYTYTFPLKTGTVALTSDVDTVQTSLDNKVNQITKYDDTNFVYARQLGLESYYVVSDKTTYPETIPLRDKEGHIAGSTPVKDCHVANKLYVDRARVPIVDLTIRG